MEEGGLIGWSERSKRWGTTDRRSTVGGGEQEREVAGRDGRAGRKEEKIEGWEKKRKKMRWRAASRRKCRCVK